MIKSKFLVVLDHDQKTQGHTAVSLLSSMGCQVVVITTKDRTHAGELAEAVKRNKADLGIRIDQDACHVSILSDEGKIISHDMLIALHLLIHCKDHPSLCLGIPVSAPEEMEQLASQVSMKVVRTKESARDMMQVVEGVKFQPLFDAFYSMVKLIGFLAEKEQPLSQLVKEIPPFHMAHRAVFCDWENKGKVMRMMMEETKGKEVELLDGIKVFDFQWLGLNHAGHGSTTF